MTLTDKLHASLAATMAEAPDEDKVGGTGWGWQGSGRLCSWLQRPGSAVRRHSASG